MDLNGRTILITGSTNGVGRRAALMLGAAGARVLVHGRDRERGEQVVEELRRNGSAAPAFYSADLASLTQVRSLADAIDRDHDRLHVLVNNAGIGTGPSGSGRRMSADDCELRFAVNYLASFVLTRRLLPLLQAGAPARIVNVASMGQQPLDFDDVMLEHGYSGGRAYMQSKLAQIMFTFDLARELEGMGVAVNAVHPATLMDTTMVRESGATPRSNVGTGAESLVHVAASPELEGVTGRYFEGKRPARAEPQAYEPDARERLRELSSRLTQ